MQFDNPDEAMKYLLLKKKVTILEEMLKEKLQCLCEKDKKILFDNILGEKNEDKKGIQDENEK